MQLDTHSYSGSQGHHSLTAPGSAWLKTQHTQKIWALGEGGHTIATTASSLESAWLGPVISTGLVFPYLASGAPMPKRPHPHPHPRLIFTPFTLSQAG